MKNFMIALSDVGAASGLALGLSNVYNILGIILIVVNLGILIFNFVCRTIDRLKDGRLSDQEKADSKAELEALQEQIQELQDELNKAKKQ